MRPLLDDPRIVVHVDDGRRWLKRHPGERYDLVVMNTSVAWRAYATNLLSREFLLIVRRHLNEGGVVHYNASVSDDAVKTAASVFRHVRRHVNFVLAGDAPFLPPAPEFERRLQALTLDGRRAVDPRHRRRDRRRPLRDARGNRTPRAAAAGDHHRPQHDQRVQVRPQRLRDVPAGVIRRQKALHGELVEP